MENQIIDTEMFSCVKSTFLLVLFTNQKITEIAGNNIVIFDTNFNIVYEFIGTHYYYTSAFKWISFGVSDMINMAFTIIMSKSVHLMMLNIRVCHLYIIFYGIFVKIKI